MIVFNYFYIATFYLSIFGFNLVIAFYVYEMRLVKSLIESQQARDYIRSITKLRNERNMVMLIEGVFIFICGIFNVRRLILGDLELET